MCGGAFVDGNTKELLDGIYAIIEQRIVRRVAVTPLYLSCESDSPTAP